MAQLLWSASLRWEVGSFLYLMPLPQPPSGQQVERTKSWSIILWGRPSRLWTRGGCLRSVQKQASWDVPVTRVLLVSWRVYARGERGLWSRRHQKQSWSEMQKALWPEANFILHLHLHICKVHRYFWCESVWVYLNYWGSCGWKPQNQPTNQTRLQ